MLKCKGATEETVGDTSKMFIDSSEALVTIMQQPYDKMRGSVGAAMKNKLYCALAAVRDWDVENFKRCSHFVLPQPLRRKVKAALDTMEESGFSPNKQSDAICPKSAVVRIDGKIVCMVNRSNAQKHIKGGANACKVRGYP